MALPRGKPVSQAVAASLYIDLLKRAVMNTLYGDQLPVEERHLVSASEALERARKEFAGLLKETDEQARKILDFSAQRWARAAVRNQPNSHTMCPPSALENTQVCIETALRDEVPGDLLEAGVWRGGMAIFMRGVLKAHRVIDRTVWLADSFEGLPKPDPTQDVGDAIIHELLATANHLRATDEEVRANFERYDLLDDQVRFLKGWFAESLPTAEIERLAVLRCDGDYYESTWPVLEHLYPKVSVGGFIIIDEYRSAGCARAVDEFRAKHGISDVLVWVNHQTAYWRRTR
jgi:hypothetical protein